MPVRIQEFIIQTKIKSSTQELVRSQSNTYITKQDLKIMEERLQGLCKKLVEDLLYTRQER
jgi:hypothetical protein